MLNKSELKSLVMTYFNLQENTNPTKDTFVETTLEDGTRVTNMLGEDLAVGQELHVITEDGTHVVAPSGEHILSDGTVVTVNEEGKITGIDIPGVEAEGSLEADNNEEMSAEEVTESTEEKTELAEHGDEEVMEEDESIVEEGIQEAIIGAIAEVVGPEIEAMKAKLAEVEEAMASMKEKMSEPATEPTLEARFSKAKNETKKPTNVLQSKNALQMEMAKEYFNKKSKK